MAAVVQLDHVEGPHGGGIAQDEIGVFLGEGVSQCDVHGLYGDEVADFDFAADVVGRAGGRAQGREEL